MENRKPVTPALRPLEDTDVATWELPEGAIGRLGQGGLLGVEYSHDGAYLAVATKIGFWIYDMATMTPRALWAQNAGCLMLLLSRMICDGSLPAIKMALLKYGTHKTVSALRK